MIRRRRAAISELEYRDGNTTLRAGLTHANDKLSDGTTNKSTLAKLGASQRLFDGKLELSGANRICPERSGRKHRLPCPSQHRRALPDQVRHRAGRGL